MPTNSKRYINSRFYSKHGFTPTPQHGVMPCAFFKVKKLFRHGAVYLSQFFKTRRHKSTTPSLVSGFTLVETMIAVLILTVSIGGPLSIVTKGLTAAFFARDQITAFYLAQEAVEFIRNRRDANTLSGNSWLTGFDDCRSGNVCDVDISTNNPANQIIPCPGGTCPPLLYDEVSGFYKHGPGTGAEFTRNVRLGDVPGTSDEIAVTVDISWNTGRLSRSFRVKEHIFNWQQP